MYRLNTKNLFLYYAIPEAKPEKAYSRLLGKDTVTILSPENEMLWYMSIPKHKLPDSYKIETSMDLINTLEMFQFEKDLFILAADSLFINKKNLETLCKFYSDFRGNLTIIGKPHNPGDYDWDKDWVENINNALQLYNNPVYWIETECKGEHKQSHGNSVCKCYYDCESNLPLCFSCITMKRMRNRE